ncbi:MAG: CRISPR-associated protein Cas4 [Campylobacterales bacterium]|nr:CRISPR-associated protein Cas4 [Campylobacterales bacterium]
MDEPVLLSMLEHYAFCPRQCALIHIEQVWDENLYTLKGTMTHERVDEVGSSQRDSLHVERALPLWNERLGLSGKADVVEFHAGVPYPVEYKSGRMREGVSESIQLCAQALCLEEMFDKAVPEGALYWIASRKRIAVTIDEALRTQTLEIIDEVRTMMQTRKVPSAIADKRCTHCSLLSSCMPKLPDQLKGYLDDDSTA